MSENRRHGGDVACAPGTPIHSEDFARTFAKRPGMSIGEANFEPAVGFIQELQHALFLRVRTPEDLAALPTHWYRERSPEPVIAAAFAELRQGELDQADPMGWPEERRRTLALIRREVSLIVSTE